MQGGGRVLLRRSASGVIGSSGRHRNLFISAPTILLDSDSSSLAQGNHVQSRWYSALDTGRWNSTTSLSKTQTNFREALFLGNRFQSTAASTVHVETNTPKFEKQGTVNASLYLKRDDIGFAHPKWLQNLLVKNYSQIAVKAEAYDVSKKDGEDGIGSSSNNILRPLSPHLPVYMPQATSTSSILHRISWCLLSFMALTSYFVCLKMGLICFTYAGFYEILFAASKLILISAEMSALAVFYLIFHMFV